MNEIINKLLLAGDKFMPEMHLRKPGFIYSACGPFTKSKNRTQKFKETRYSRYIYRNKLDKMCFQHGMLYGNLKVCLEEQVFLQWFINFLIKKLWWNSYK